MLLRGSQVRLNFFRLLISSRQACSQLHSSLHRRLDTGARHGLGLASCGQVFFVCLPLTGQFISHTLDQQVARRTRRQQSCQYQPPNPSGEPPHIAIGAAQ